MVEKGMSCVKYLLFFFNLLFFIFGVVLLGVGIYAMVALSKYLDFGLSVNGPGILLIVVGVITLIVGFFGCCGAVKENHCMVMTFAILIGIILVCEIGTGIAGYVLKDKVEDLISDGMKKSMGKYHSEKGVKTAWDVVQKEFKCCGTNNYTEWNGTIPESCCPDDTKGPCTPTVSHFYKEPCLQKIQDDAMSKIGIIAGTGIGLAVVEIAGIILACCLASAIRNEYEVA